MVTRKLKKMAHPDKALQLLQEVSKFDTIRIKGLMTIGLFSAAPEQARASFRLLKQIQQEAVTLNIPGIEVSELSMGMSNDLEVAIQEGATIVRVGTASFGQRQYPDSYYWDESAKVK